MTNYTIDRGLGVRDRMDLLAAVFAPSTLALLDAVGIASGASCIDVGCGGGHVAIELGRRVGPIEDSKGRIALRPDHPSARSIYQPAVPSVRGYGLSSVLSLITRRPAAGCSPGTEAATPRTAGQSQSEGRDATAANRGGGTIVLQGKRPRVDSSTMPDPLPPRAARHETARRAVAALRRRGLLAHLIPGGAARSPLSLP